MHPKVTVLHVSSLIERPRIVSRTSSSIAEQSEASAPVNTEHRKCDGDTDQEALG